MSRPAALQRLAVDSGKHPEIGQDEDDGGHTGQCQGEKGPEQQLSVSENLRREVSTPFPLAFQETIH